jgi:hypothetical protein
MQQFEIFKAQLHKVGDDLYPSDRIDLAFENLDKKYDQLLKQSFAEGWSREQEDAKVRQLILGKGEDLLKDKHITPEFIGYFVPEWTKDYDPMAALSSQAAVTPTVVADDDFVIAPFGMEDMPDDAGAMPEERIKPRKAATVYVEDVEAIKPAFDISP